MNLSCIVVEDSEIESEHLTSLIGRVDFVKLLGVFNNAIKAMEFINDTDPDLIISDIMMPDINGLQMIRTLKDPPQVIFTSAHDDFALESIDLEVTDYIVKPVTFDRFLIAVNRAMKKKHLLNLQKTKVEEDQLKEDHFFIRSDLAFVKIYYHDILYLESIENYVRIVTSMKSFLTFLTMKAIEEQIPGDVFIRIHRKYIVNLQKIDALKNEDVIIGTHELPVSNSFKENLFSRAIGNNIIKR